MDWPGPANLLRKKTAGMVGERQRGGALELSYGRASALFRPILANGQVQLGWEKRLVAFAARLDGG